MSPTQPRERTFHEGPWLVADEAGEFEGYASLFHAADLAGDAVQPGAFAASLQAKGPGGVRMLWQHDPAEPVGRWLSLVEDARGLRVRGRLNSGVARAREAMALLVFAGAASVLAGRLLKELGAANRRFDDFVRELARFNHRHGRDLQP